MLTKRSVYMDHSASTPTDPRVVEAMMPYFTEIYGNSSSAHSFGRRAEQAVENSRETIARILNCKLSEVIFTSGGSESDNLALRGAAWLSRREGKGNRIITTPIEHSAVHKTVNQLYEVMGFEVIYLPVDRAGIIDFHDFNAACQYGAAVASVVYASNEVGTIQDLSTLAASTRRKEIIFHTDAVQAAGQLTLDVEVLGVDMLSLSAHKFYGPKGVGVLYIRNGVEVISAQSGGGHEAGRRAGTHSTPLIVGMAKALELAYEEMDEWVPHYTVMRDQLIEGIFRIVPGATLTGDRLKRLPSHTSFVFDDVESNALIMHLDMNGVAASSGSACTTGNPEPSSVLMAMGYTAKEALGSLRLTVGRQTTEADVDYTVTVLGRVIEKLRKLNREMAY